jgi:hypothetical protein
LPINVYNHTRLPNVPRSTTIYLILVNWNYPVCLKSCGASHAHSRNLRFEY